MIYLEKMNSMGIILDIFWLGIVGWLIYLYVRNTNRVVTNLIKELEHKRKRNEQETNDSSN
jgi:hypothetical protein